MSEQEKPLSVDWRVALGLCITTVWITTGVIYLSSIVGWEAFALLPTADIGSFLEGAFAPLAFLWLVIGHFMQQKEISSNTRAIQIQEQSARRQELHAQRDTYFKLLNLIQEQLGTIASFHYFSVNGPTGNGSMSTDEFIEGRAQANAGDYGYFVRLMSRMSFEYRDDTDAINEIYFGTDIRKRHTENYIQTFEKLLNAAREADTDDMLNNALLFGSASGRQYRIIKYIQGGDPKELELFM